MELNEMSNQDNIRMLSDLREQALELIKQYNELAELEKYETRIGVIDATIETDDMKYEMAMETLGENSDEEPSEELINSMVVDVDQLERNNVEPYWTTKFPGAKKYFWAPSGINCQEII